MLLYVAGVLGRRGDPHARVLLLRTNLQFDQRGGHWHQQGDARARGPALGRVDQPHRGSFLCCCCYCCCLLPYSRASCPKFAGPPRSCVLFCTCFLWPHGYLQTPSRTSLCPTGPHLRCFVSGWCAGRLNYSQIPRPASSWPSGHIIGRLATCNILLEISSRFVMYVIVGLSLQAGTCVCSHGRQHSEPQVGGAARTFVCSVLSKAHSLLESILHCLPLSRTRCSPAGRFA